ncbi:MAG: AsmA family protein, partial [Billgrantia desiderata]
MNKLARRVVITTGAVLLVLLGAVLYLESAWFRGWLESQASEQLGRDVEIGGHGIDWGLPLTLRLDDVRVANAPWAEAPMASLDELSVTLDVGALLGGEIVLERLAVVRPEVRLLRREDGTTNIDDLIDEPTEEQEIALWPETFSIDQGRLVYRDESQRIDLDVAFDTPSESIEHL